MLASVPISCCSKRNNWNIGITKCILQNYTLGTLMYELEIMNCAIEARNSATEIWNCDVATLKTLAIVATQVRISSRQIPMPQSSPDIGFCSISFVFARVLVQSDITSDCQRSMTGSIDFLLVFIRVS